MAAPGLITNNLVNQAEYWPKQKSDTPTPPTSGSGGKKGASVNDYYNAILKSLGSSSISPDTITYEALGYTMPTQAELSAQIAGYLRPQYDSAISGRKAQTTQNRAAIDIDAASRGMGASTWVTDAKTRQMNSEAADIANLESNYGSTLAQNVLNLYNQHLQNKLNVDTFDKSNQLTVDQQNVANKMTAAQWNEQMRRALEETAYARAMDAYNLSKSRKGSGIDPTGVKVY